MNFIQQIIKDSDYGLSLFNDNEINSLNDKIKMKENKGIEKPYINCIIRNKEILLTPEEVVRQLYTNRLIELYNYPKERFVFEYPIYFGREAKRADIVIKDKDDLNVAYIIIEVKKPKAKDGREQLKSYTHGTGATMAVWTNGQAITYHHRKNPNYFEDIPGIPLESQKLEEILMRPFTMDDLIREDKLTSSGKSLKQLIEEMEDEVLANAGVDVFEEVFKLIFAKLYDEQLGASDKKRNLEFRNTGLTDIQLKDKIQKLFEKSCEKWDGVFAEDAKINLTPPHLSICVASLEGVKLFNSNLDVVDEAFEYLMSKSSKGEKGQYFTPRYVIDMCVKMLNPKADEYLIDPAAGSSGFTVHSIFHVWKNLLKEHNESIGHLFTAEHKPSYCTEYVQDMVFAIDFDEKAVRVARTLNLIAGDGQTNVLHLNTLDFTRWETVTKEEAWNDTYNNGFKKLKKLRSGNDYHSFNFDVLMANPPFAGDIKESQMLSRYELAMKNGKTTPAVGRDILFIERNLSFLKPGGRMAIVLPQGRFNNSSDKYIRDYIAERCRILAVVGLHGNTFKPHTGTKTSVLFVQKWNDDPKAGALCPKINDYNIFFATQRLEGKDNSGEKLYFKADQSGSTTDPKLALCDDYGHSIIYHDLHNSDGKTADGIAEAFMEFASKEKLSFFLNRPFDEAKYRALLEGLEVSIYNLEDVLLDNPDFRIHSEFFKKTYHNLYKKIKQMKVLLLKDCAKIADGDHSKFPENEMQEIRYLQAKDIKDYFIENNNPVYVSKEYFYKNKRSHIFEENILMSIMGNVGDITIAPKGFEPCISNRALAIIKDIRNINPYYLFSYLISDISKLVLDRLINGGVQERINLDILSEIPIPILNKDFQIKIEDLVKTAQNIRQNSIKSYTEAENLLLSELGLKERKLTEETESIKSFSESYVQSGRLDAEYYQPKYDEIIDIIKKSSHKKLKEIANSFSGFAFESNKYISKGVQIIRIQNISDKYINLDRNPVFWEDTDLSLLNKFKIDKNDILMAMTGETIGKCSINTSDNLLLLNQRVLSIRAMKTIIPEFLYLFLSSFLFQSLIERECVGSAQPNISKEYIENQVVPILPIEIQQAISGKVINSYKFREQSKKLLDLAKRGVEMAIERGEEKAIAWMVTERFEGRL